LISASGGRKGTAILFAVGAVSGTVLSFELGLLWPGFMEHAGAIIGMPFSLEGFAFFTEAIFLGVYLYGWKRVSPLIHWLSGVVVALSGILSGIFVVTANAWMNAPAGFKIVDGKFAGIDPIAANVEPRFFSRSRAMTLAHLWPRALWWRQFMHFFCCVTGAIPFIEPRWASPLPLRVSPCHCKSSAAT